LIIVVDKTRIYYIDYALPTLQLQRKTLPYIHLVMIYYGQFYFKVEIQV